MAQMDLHGLGLVSYCHSGVLLRVFTIADAAVGETKALASVSGPIEVRLAQEQASKATFEVNVRPLAGIAGESHCIFGILRRLTSESTVFFLVN